MTEFTVDDLLAIVRSCGVEADTPLDEAALDLDVEELGLDSLAVLQIVSLIEKRTSMVIPETAVEDWQTLRQIMDDVTGRLKVA